MRVLDLFSGTGAFSMALEQAGMETVAFCEIEPYCREILRQHWEVPIYDDIKTLTASTLERDGIVADVICGGFPCTDLSYAGKRAGLEGERSGLWGEYRRLIDELQPRFVIIENVPGLLTLGLEIVLRDLAALRYDAIWDCIPASAIGAHHKRDRIWIVAHAVRERGCSRDAARQHAKDAGQPPRHKGDDAGGVGGGRTQRGLGRVVDGVPRWVDASSWLEEPKGVPRIAKGQENRAARLKALGNAVVPQIPFMLGKAIMEACRDKD